MMEQEYLKLLTARSFHNYFVDNSLQGKQYYIAFKYLEKGLVSIQFEFKGFIMRDIIKEIPFVTYQSGELNESGSVTLKLNDLSKLVDKEAEDRYLKEESLFNLDYERRLREYNITLDQVQDSEAYLCIPLQVGRYYNFQLDTSLRGNGWKDLESEFRRELERELIEKLRAKILPKRPYRVKSQLWDGRIKSYVGSLFEFQVE